MMMYCIGHRPTKIKNLSHLELAVTITARQTKLSQSIVDCVNQAVTHSFGQPLAESGPLDSVSE